jgi:hypothetical protein
MGGREGESGESSKKRKGGAAEVHLFGPYNFVAL